LPDDLVREFVVAGHHDLDLVKKMLEKVPKGDPSPQNRSYNKREDCRICGAEEKSPP
jgi:hypothetical protein